MTANLTPMESPETDLIKASKNGDNEAFSELIRRYEGRIFNLAHKVCVGLPAEAEDVYQETFLTAFKKIGQFRSSSALGTWLYRIAANLCWMRLRKKKRDPFVPLLDQPHGQSESENSGRERRFKDWSINPEEMAGKKELGSAVAKAMGKLPVKYRLVVALRDIEGLSNKEIAKILDISLPAVKSRLHRGRLYIRDGLNKWRI
ncbi:MAG: RNA polymerase sigma factor [Elusimicrobiota bacterium]